MADRLLHPAPPDYGIVEAREPGKASRFLVYHRGREIARCGTLDQATALTESDQVRIAERRNATSEDDPRPAGRS